MNGNPIFTDTSKGQQKKLIALIVGIVFFWFCGKTLFDPAILLRLYFSLGVDLSVPFGILGVLCYIMCAAAVIGIPVNFITVKNCRISVYEWGVEGVGKTMNPFAPVGFRLTYDKLTEAPKCQSDIVKLTSAEGKYMYHASNKAAAAQICDIINKYARPR